MDEATHSAEMMFGLWPPTGRGGGRLYAGYLQIDDGETIDTGMDFIHALVTCPVVNLANNSTFAGVNAVATTGTATMSCGDWDDPSSGSAGSNHYVLAVGVLY